MGIILRDYQEEAVKRTLKSFSMMQAPMLVLATGAGKTVIFSEVIRRFNRRTLILAHRDELLKQAAEKIKDVWEEADVGFVKGRKCETDKQIIITSVQTLVRRLDKLPDDIELVVIDEAHHASAKSYQKILEYLGVREYDGPKLLGVTATPTRTDRKELGDTFEAIVFEKNLLELIKEGYLVDIRGLRVDTKVNLDNIKMVRGDFDEAQLAKLINTPSRNKLVVDTFFKHARNRAVVIFAVNVQHAKDLCMTFISRGIAAAVVDGTMKMDEREEILNKFTNGEIQILVNVMVLTEGTDLPRIDSVFMVRPTMSSALYTQAIGRGVRLYGEKKDCLVVDFVDNSSKHTLIQTPMLVKEDPDDEAEKLKKKKKSDNSRFDDYDGETQDENPDEEFSLMELLAATEAESDTGSIGLVPVRSSFSWVALIDMKGFALSYGEKNALLLLPADEHGGKWVVYNLKDGSVRDVISKSSSLETAQNTAENWIRKNQNQVNFAFVKKNLKWRDQPVSDEQAASLKRSGHVVPETKGEASDLIRRITMSRIARNLKRQFTG